MHQKQEKRKANLKEKEDKVSSSQSLDSTESGVVPCQAAFECRSKAKQQQKKKQLPNSVKLLLEEDYDNVGCRICLEEQENKLSGLLGNFCNCKGSISMLHINCLEIHLQMQFKDCISAEREFSTRCELCQAEYKLGISKRIYFNPAQNVFMNVGQKKKMLTFLVVIFLMSFYTSYMINEQIKEYINAQNIQNQPLLQPQVQSGFDSNPKQSQNSTTDDFDLNSFANIEHFDLKAYFSASEKKTPMNINTFTKKNDFRDSLQVTLSYLLIGFFCTTSLFSFVLLFYNLFTIFFYTDVFISKRSLPTIKKISTQTQM